MDHSIYDIHLKSGISLLLIVLKSLIISYNLHDHQNLVRGTLGYQRRLLLYNSKILFLIDLSPPPPPSDPKGQIRTINQLSVSAPIYNSLFHLLYLLKPSGLAVIADHLLGIFANLSY